MKKVKEEFRGLEALLAEVKKSVGKGKYKYHEAIVSKEFLLENGWTQEQIDELETMHEEDDNV